MGMHGTAIKYFFLRSSIVVAKQRMKYTMLRITKTRSKIIHSFAPVIDDTVSKAFSGYVVIEGVFPYV